MHYLHAQHLAFLVLTFFLLTAEASSAQCISSVFIEVTNPSFEGTPGPHVTPTPWNTCGITPDTQPGSWGVALAPSDGNTYLGLVASEPAWLEGASQELITPLTANTFYGFEIDLSATAASGGGINPNAFNQLEVWGGNTLCDKGELLWTSPVIDHLGWQTYLATFTPTSNHDFIYLVVSGSNNAYLLVDNLKEPSQQTSVLDVLTPIDSMATSCTVNLAGVVDETTIDSILIEGAFQNSPLSISTNDSPWNADLLYTQGGYDGITVSAFYTDTASGIPLICSQVNLTIEVTAPQADFIATGHCSNTPFEFDDLSIPFDTNSIVSWTWDFAGLGTSTDQHPTALLDTSGLIDIQLVIESSDGCIDDTTISMEVLAGPDVNFSFTEVCLGGSTNFHDLSDEGDESIINWSWNFDDGNTSILEDPVHSYADTGEYQVQLVVTDFSGCTDSIVQGVEVFLCASVNETQLSEAISIYPNPATDHLRIESGQYTINRFRILDSAGKLVMTEDIANGNVIPIVLPNLSYGVYSLELTIDDHGVIYKPFIIR